MPPYGPVTNRDLVAALKRAGFDGPYPGSAHRTMNRGGRSVTIPIRTARTSGPTSWREFCGAPASPARNGSGSDALPADASLSPGPLVYNQRVFTDYLDAAMHAATYEFLDDSREYYGEIPVCQGVWATAATLEACRDELRDVLESWILFRVAAHMDLPTVSGVELPVPDVA